MSRSRLILSRQNMPTLDRTKYAPAAGVAKGGYVLADAPGGKPDVILIGTGSEVGLSVDAYEKLVAEGVKAQRGQHAVLGTVRSSEPGIPGLRAAAIGKGARFRGAGFDHGLEPVCRRATSA